MVQARENLVAAELFQDLSWAGYSRFGGLRSSTSDLSDYLHQPRSQQWTAALHSALYIAPKRSTRQCIPARS